VSRRGGNALLRGLSGCRYRIGLTAENDDVRLHVVPGVLVRHSSGSKSLGDEVAGSYHSGCENQEAHVIVSD
jgi:hypothetical protein